MIVLAGPSGAGKSRLAERIGLPVLRLDDFYRSAGDPSLPTIRHGANRGLVDWDDPASWLLDDAMAALDELCRTGRAEVPLYDIAHDGRRGWQTLDLDGHDVFVAEGIFAQEVVPRAREAGLLEAAYCVRQHPMVTFWRRLTRDLREHRKPPLVLLRRGLALMRDQQRVVAHAVALGCRPVTGDEAYAEIRGLRRSRPSGPSWPSRRSWCEWHSRRSWCDWRSWPAQPDGFTCGPSVVVVARELAEGRPGPSPDFRERVLATHRRIRGLWPRWLGTPPWAVARELGGRVRWIRGRGYDAVLAALSRRPVPVYLGSWWLPRHVVLALGERDGEPLVYDPARGAVVPVSTSRWRTAWWAIV